MGLAFSKRAGREFASAALAVSMCAATVSLLQHRFAIPPEEKQSRQQSKKGVGALQEQLSQTVRQATGIADNIGRGERQQAVQVSNLLRELSERNGQIQTLMREGANLEQELAQEQEKTEERRPPQEVLDSLVLLQKNPRNGQLLSRLWGKLWLVDNAGARHCILASYCLGCRLLGNQKAGNVIHRYFLNNYPSSDYSELTSQSPFMKPCEACNGKGLLRTKCTTCNGSGKCTTCGGTGRITRRKSISGRGGASLPCYICNASGKCPHCKGQVI